MGKTPRLIDAGDDDIAEGEKAYDGGYDEKSDLAQATVEASAELGGDFTGVADDAAHDREFGRGNRHAKKADWKSVESLRVGESGDGTGRQPTGEEGVNVGADLDDTTADKNREEVADDDAHVFGLMGEGELQSTEKFEDRGKLDGDLECTANDRGPSGEDDKGVLRAAGAKGDHARDHGDVPEDGRGVGDEELAVAVENTEAPGGSDEEAGAREEDAHKENGELAFFTVETWGDGFNQPRSREHSEKNEHRSAKREQSSDGTGGFARFFLIAAGKEVGVDRNEGGGQDAFAEEILEKIRDTESGFKDVSGVGVAEIVGEDAIADKSSDAAEEDAGGDEKGEAAGARGLCAGSGRFGHKNSQRIRNNRK